MTKGIIAIDFDGVICNSSGWVDLNDYRPIKGSFESICKIRLRGFKVIIFTARPTEQVGQWLLQNWPRVAPYGDIPEVTNIKPHAIAYIDDHAIHFSNWEQTWEALKPLMK